MASPRTVQAILVCRRTRGHTANGRHHWIVKTDDLAAQMSRGLQIGCKPTRLLCTSKGCGPSPGPPLVGYNLGKERLDYYCLHRRWLLSLLHPDTILWMDARLETRQKPRRQVIPRRDLIGVWFSIALPISVVRSVSGK